jgi:peptidyl-prolyl cis-trans isomerase A (cyclophilin A)
MGETPRVLVETILGDIEINVDEVKAPLTSVNFLRYVDAGLYDGTTFFRAVTMDNQPNDAVKIEVIQGGQLDKAREYPPIVHETTVMTRAPSLGRGRNSRHSSRYLR